MKLLRFSLGLAFILTHAALADVQVLFQNNVFTPPRLVTFGSPLGNLTGTGVRNGVFGNASYVAQLFQVIGTKEIPIGPRVNFRAAATSSPGTWSGAIRTIPGASPGEIVYLRVKAWDASAESFECAYGRDLLAGASVVFAYQEPIVVSQPVDLYMANFRGFEIGVPLTPCRYGWPFHDLSTSENSPVALPHFWFPPEYWFSAFWLAASEANQRSGTKRGEVALVGGAITYTPNSNSYGEEAFFGFCCDLPVRVSTVTIEPSPMRPYLAVTAGEGSVQHHLVLRGLAPRRYRVEQSENLSAWEPVGEFTASFSEVPVQDLSLASTAARFYRAVELGN